MRIPEFKCYVALLGKQYSKHISSADHQDIAETMHKNRVQYAFASLVDYSLDCSKDKRINDLKIISFEG